MKKRIFVSVTNDMTNDQRVNRVCNSLHNRNIDVIVLCRKLKNSSNIETRNYKIHQFRLLFTKGFLFYLCFNLRLFGYLLFHKSDMLLANDLDTLLANSLISKIKKIPLYYDSHELFTEVPELENTKFKKNIWLLIEKMCIHQPKASYTVCNSIAEIYNEKYHLNMKVVRNLPTLKSKHDYYERKNIFLYQGALNIGRGIELLIEMMQFFPNYKLYIAGKGYLEKELKLLSKKLHLTDKVIFTGNLGFEELHKLTSSAKIGFSIEQGTSLNYKYALPNKIFDYIQAGTPIVCANLPEMKAIIEQYAVGKVFSNNDVKSLTALVEKMLENEKMLYDYHKNCLFAAEILNWENEEKTLLDIYNL